MKVGIVGKGDFGYKIHSKLPKDCEIVFFTGTAYEVSYDIDWVIIASSTNSHYDIAKDFLSRSINVFCEKPLTLDSEHSRELYDIAEINNCKLYVDDIFRYRNEYRENKKKLSIQKNLTFTWKKYGSFKDYIEPNLMYHDLYLLTDLLGEDTPTEIQYSINQVNKKTLKFRYKNRLVKLNYDRLCKNKIKTINKINFNQPTNDALEELLREVLTEKANFDYNKHLTLTAQKLLDTFIKYSPSIAVIGAGIFGITAALELASAGLNVTLYEEQEEILTKASNINQYRIHRGYHYPRSKETAISSKHGGDAFIEKYKCTSPSCKHYYAIASSQTLTTAEQYKNFLDQVGLEYEECSLPQIKPGSVDLIISASEELFDPKALKVACKNYLLESNITVKTSTSFTKDLINNYDYVVNTTYAKYNKILPRKFQQDFQFELCEKPVLKLPKEYKGVSIVVMDGPFTCIDPLGDTDYHVMGNVVHAIHHTNVGKIPKIPQDYLEVLDKGVVKDTPLTKVDTFIEAASSFFANIEKSSYIGSMFTVRTVLPRRDYDDARPTLVKRHTDKLYSLFSGKIVTCVDSAKELVNNILKS